MNQAEKQWWDEFYELCQAYRHSPLIPQEHVRDNYNELCNFVSSALDHDAFTHSKR